MILFKTTEIPSNMFSKSLRQVKAYRWIFEIKRWSVELNHQYKTDSGWHHGGGYYALSITDYWSLGRVHCYYDGPHDSFSLGFLHFNWQGDWCDKCAEGA